MNEEMERLARAYCDKAPDPNNPVHRRLVTVVHGMERETCKYCGHVKEHAPVQYGDSEPYFELPLPDPEMLEHGFHTE